MIIRKIFSSPDSERLYSVLLTEDEMIRLFGEEANEGMAERGTLKYSLKSMIPFSAEAKDKSDRKAEMWGKLLS